jgi:hypothetical protein
MAQSFVAQDGLSLLGITLSWIVIGATLGTADWIQGTLRMGWAHRPMRSSLLQRKVLPKRPRDPHPQWRWPLAERPERKPYLQFTDEEWRECQLRGDRLPNEARRQLENAITESYADRETRDETRTAAVTRKELRELKTLADALHARLNAVWGENREAAELLRPHEALLECILENMEALSEIALSMDTQVKPSPKGDNLGVEHRLMARVRMIVGSYGKKLATTRKNPSASGKHWPTFIKLVFQAAQIPIEDETIMTLLRRAVSESKRS